MLRPIQKFSDSGGLTILWCKRIFWDLGIFKGYDLNIWGDSQTKYSHYIIVLDTVCICQAETGFLDSQEIRSLK